MEQITLFGDSIKLEKISKLGDNLEKLKEAIDFEIFRKPLKEVFKDRSHYGRPEYDYVLMFKILILQRLYNMSDDQTEYQINDRLSFARFLNIDSKIPDAKTIWAFRENLVKAGVIKDLFDIFYNELEKKKLVTHKGTIVDATLVEVPKQRNDRETNKEIKAGEMPKKWQETPNVNMIRQKDVDARWTIKGGQRYYGYKNHIKADKDSKLIIDYGVTSANVHDSQKFIEFLNKEDKKIYADSAYSGIEIASRIPKHIKNKIIEKGYRNNPLTKTQEKKNRTKSKTRCRIEHIFGFMTKSMNQITARCIGINRIEFNIGITNLVYNLCRYKFLTLKV